MKGFIFAAGEGTRLYPVVLETPKPLITVHKIPVLTYLVELYLEYQVNDIQIIIQEKHEEDFRNWKAHFFSEENIDFIIEKKPSGTFGALSKIKSSWFSERIVVSNGDELKEINIKKMKDWHVQKGGVVTIGLVKVSNPQDYGVVTMDGDRIIEFIEKPKVPPSNYINSGIYIMEPRIMSYYPPKAKFSMLETDLFPKLVNKKKLYGYKFKGNWQDTGTFERWEKAIKTWKRKK